MVAFRIDLKEGSLVDDKYRIIKKLGSGSYGDVFLVQDQRRHYAMKILRLFDEVSDLHEDLVRRFRQEYDTAKMPGEYFVHSFDYSEVKGNPYFTMEFCPNGDLAKFVGRKTELLPRLAHDILVGLYDLHSRGKIHRDLKPENVLIRENKSAALTDFGTVGDKNNKWSTKNLFGRPRQRFGTPMYMAPEMNDLKGGGITYLPTIDIWSFGVMVYELLTGGMFPFGDPKNITEFAQYQVNAKKGIWSRQILRELPNGREWLPIIEKCLKANYQERCQNVLEILKDLEPLIGTTGPEYPIECPSRSASISKIVITQGQDTGKVFRLYDIIEGRGRMVRVGRSVSNDIVLKDNEDTYVSRHHFTLEFSPDSRVWIIKDGQWIKEEHRWNSSTNGTFLNASPVTQRGQKLFTGDIVTAGEYKLIVE